MAYAIGLLILALELINKIIALPLTAISVVVVAGVVIAIFVNEKEKREMKKENSSNFISINNGNYDNGGL